MLILTRKPEESLIITTADGQQIEVLVVKVNGNQVRLGIAADASIRVVRDELVKQASRV